MAKAKNVSKKSPVVISVDTKPDTGLDSTIVVPGNDGDIDKHPKELHEAMKPYVEAYKEHKSFLVSSDGQVFLMSNKQDAMAHQKSLDPKKELITYSL